MTCYSPSNLLINGKESKKNQNVQGLKLQIVNFDASGVEVSSTEMQVYVPEDRDLENNRRFGTFTED